MRHMKLKLLGLGLIATSLSVGPQMASAQYEQGHEQHRDFYNGAYNAGRGGNYNQGQDYGNRGYYNRGYGDRNHYSDRRYDDRDHGHGIGTGTGAAIGGAGGALLGAAFGGGLKGAIIGGAAGAGIGAIAGHAHQENERRDDYRR